MKKRRRRRRRGKERERGMGNQKAIASRTGAHAPSGDTHGEEGVAEVSVRASKRLRTDEGGKNPFAASAVATASSVYGGDANTSRSAQQIREAYKALSGRGSTGDTMASVANIVAQQRRKGFR